MKNEWLKKARGVSFEEILDATLVDVIKHPKREHQVILVYEYKKYLWAVPGVSDGKVVFLKTLYPSRKLRKMYGDRL